MQTLADCPCFSHLTLFIWQLHHYGNRVTFSIMQSYWRGAWAIPITRCGPKIGHAAAAELNKLAQHWHGGQSQTRINALIGFSCYITMIIVKELFTNFVLSESASFKYFMGILKVFMKWKLVLQHNPMHSYSEVTPLASVELTVRQACAGLKS